MPKCSKPSSPCRTASGPAALRWGAVLLCAALLTACGGGASGDGGETGGSPPPSGNQPVNADARLLASNCFQCHGTGGTGGFENIRGGEADEVREYRQLASRPASSDIMAAHAQGYTDAQIALIISYLQQ